MSEYLILGVHLSSTTSFDISPTSLLTGLHMLGTVTKRFLINYPVEPELLTKYIPPKAELSLYNGKAWLSACFVSMNDMRPSFAPHFLGMSYNYLIFRTRAKLPFPDGKLREGVLVLEPNINKRILSVAGSFITKIDFNYQKILLTKTDKNYHIQMKNKDQVLFDANISLNNSPKLPQTSYFKNTAEADEFLLGVSYGGQWNKKNNSLCLLPETHEPWKALVSSSTTKTNTFLDELGCPNIEADHVIVMDDIPHYFGISPYIINLK